MKINTLKKINIGIIIFIFIGLFLSIYNYTFASTLNYSPSSYSSIWVENATWATARNATTGTTRASGGYASNYFTSNNYHIERGFFVFDTSDIPLDETIISATITFIGDNEINEDTGRQYAIFNSNSADTITGEDYDTIGNSIQSDTISSTDLTATGTIIFTLNTTGLANINTTGLTKFSLREIIKDLENSAPTDLTYWKYTSNIQLDIETTVSTGTTSETTNYIIILTFIFSVFILSIWGAYYVVKKIL